MGTDAGPGVADVAGAMRLLADGARLRLLSLLAGGELNVTELAERTAFDQQAVRHHLGILRTTRVILARRSGNRVFYRLAVPPAAPGTARVAVGTGGITVGPR